METMEISFFVIYTESRKKRQMSAKLSFDLESELNFVRKKSTFQSLRLRMGFFSVRDLL